MKTGSKALLTGTGLIAAFAIFFAVNVLSNQGLRSARIDLTEARLFTLSDGTRNVLKAIPEPITLRFFFSDKLAGAAPQIKQYGARVRELLERYAALSGGKLHLEVIDPEPFTESEDRAVQAGLQAAPLPDGGQFYFGLVGINSLDQQQAIPFFQTDREQFLEYDLTKMIYGLSSPKKPTVGILGSLPLEYGPGGMMAAMRGQSQPYLILDQIKQFFDVKMLNAGKPEEINDTLGVLILAHPKELKPQEKYAIDQFVLKGGHLIVFSDPYSETAAAMPNPMTGQPMPPGMDQSSLMNDLFKAWGVQIVPGKFVADLALAQRVQTGKPGAAAVIDYVPWLNISPEHMDHSDIVTASLTNINGASFGAIEKVDGATTKITPLLTSSNQAMLMDVADIQGDPNPEALAGKFKADGKTYVLAARISGPASTAFPDGAPAAGKTPDSKGDAARPAENKPAEPQVKDSVKPINVLLVADADMLDDRFWARSQQMFGQNVFVPIAANADFVVNAIDNMSGSGDLISLRSRGRSQRPFEKIEAMRRQADQQFLARQNELQKKMEDTQKKLADMQSKAQGQSNALLTAEQQATIDSFRDQLLQTRRELRNVQHQLNRGIERLQLLIKFINIGLMPLLAAVVAVGMGIFWRRRRQRRSLDG